MSGESALGLVVDDPSIRKITESLLCSVGFHVQLFNLLAGFSCEQAHCAGPLGARRFVRVGAENQARCSNDQTLFLDLSASNRELSFPKCTFPQPELGRICEPEFIIPKIALTLRGRNSPAK